MFGAVGFVGPAGAGIVAGCGVLAVAAVSAWAGTAGRRAAAQSRLSGSSVDAGGVPAWFGSAVRWADVPAVARRRRTARFHAQLPGLVDDLMASLRGGSSLVQACEVAARRTGPVGQDLSIVLAHYREGMTFQTAIDAWAVRQPATVGLADALALAGATGASQVRALAGVGAGLREQQALAREVRSLGAQARLSALVMVVTPVAFAAVVSVADPRIRHFLVDTALGWACLGLGALLDIVGGWWMRLLVKGVGR